MEADNLHVLLSRFLLVLIFGEAYGSSVAKTYMKLEGDHNMKESFEIYYYPTRLLS
jgi:hypothetical protein